MGNDWVPESQVTKNNCALLRIDRFPPPPVLLQAIQYSQMPSQARTNESLSSLHW